ncbi:hypothetical protein KEH56_20625 [Burkholderia cenocepacia]|uniref:hypothetical protein n=1 Tax=Burkholderia cenocepacia TaxID=95486 RepID=UPI001BA54E3C|nr:hypothetical protein [Burkholderia cenocepacia]QUN41755.1 hypothetical protein KEH56_20625 [Burkholderia cenocepacia]QUO26854.1 hypothetical protein KEH57_08070 [Burkholderia cenocepacia]
MSSKNTMIIAVLFVLTSTFVTVSLYVFQFGTHLANNHTAWAEFGGYFGGVLNPIFALLAFFGLLWSIVRQGNEFRISLQSVREERARNDLLHVIKEIDARIENILDIDISGRGSIRIEIRQMSSEAQRLRRGSGSSPAYAEFLKIARVPGTVVEAPVRELVYLVSREREFLESYVAHQQGFYSPTLSYYADKCAALMDMLEDLGGLPVETRAFFSKMSAHSRSGVDQGNVERFAA